MNAPADRFDWNAPLVILGANGDAEALREHLEEGQRLGFFPTDLSDEGIATFHLVGYGGDPLYAIVTALEDQRYAMQAGML